MRSFNCIAEPHVLVRISSRFRLRINAETEGGDAPECTCNGRVETPLEHRPCRETAEPRRGYQTYGAASYS